MIIFHKNRNLTVPKGLGNVSVAVASGVTDTISRGEVLQILEEATAGWRNEIDTALNTMEEEIDLALGKMDEAVESVSGIAEDVETLYSYEIEVEVVRNEHGQQMLDAESVNAILDRIRQISEWGRLKVYARGWDLNGEVKEFTVVFADPWQTDRAAIAFVGMTAGAVVHDPLINMTWTWLDYDTPAIFNERNVTPDEEA